ncbi:MAG: response regulator [Candidatus Neomarinimicrobiota bacterium]
MPTILVVDDSSFSRKSILAALETEDYELLEAGDGRQALEIALTRRPDCITLDLLMPTINGRDVMRELNQRGLDIPVIVISSDIQDSTRQSCIELGARAFLNKPLQPAQLKHAIRALIEIEREANVD